MKGILIITSMFFVACSSGVWQTETGNVSKNLIPNSSSHDRQDFYVIGNFSLQLANRKGRCTLVYSNKNEGTPKDPKFLDLGMIGPCDFIRNTVSLQPIFHTYQKGEKRRSVMLITGGVPDPSATDQFQPNGCGTWQAKIRVFDDRIEMAWSGFNGPAWCPSSGADEKLYAA